MNQKFDGDESMTNGRGLETEFSESKNSSRKRKSMANKETESTPDKRRLIDKEKLQNKTIFDLPDELLMKIIRMINIGQWPSLESIDRRFRDIMNILWKQIRELRLEEFRFVNDGHHDHFLNKALCKFVCRAPNITSISGLDTKRYSSLRRSLLETLVVFEYLEQIAFGSNNFFWVNMEFFLESAACWERLKVLDMSEVSTRCTEFYQGPLNISMIQLETFIGTENAFDVARRFFDVAALKTLIMKKKLEVNPFDLISIVNQCRDLEKLEFEVPLRVEQYWSVPLFQSVAKLEYLTDLKISGGVNLDEFHVVKDLIQSLGQRRRISSIALACDDKIIREIAENLPFLKSVDLDIQRKCSSASFIKMISQLKNLESLHFRSKYGCSIINVNSRVMKSIVDNLPGLKSFHIENPRCQSTDFDDLAKFPLTELHVKGANLENSTIKLWKKSGLGSRLESLELTNWRGGLKRNVLAKLIKKSPRLHHLHLSNVTDKVAMAIASSCPFLIDLELTESDDLSLESAQSIIDHCGNLKYFRLSAPKSWNRLELIPVKYRVVKMYWA